MNTARAPQAKSETVRRGFVEAGVRDRASNWQKRLGGTAKPGWSPRKGRRLSPFLGANRVAN
jgi:hypothetical protein